MRDIDVYGHRGCRGLMPEHSVEGYKLALELGVDYLDCDIVLTKDEKIILAHDLYVNVDLIRNGKGEFIGVDGADKKNIPDKFLYKNLTLNEVKEYNIGKINSNSKYKQYFSEQKELQHSSVLELSEVLDLLKDYPKTSLQLEIKSDVNNLGLNANSKTFINKLYQLIKEHNMIARTEFQSFDYQYLLALQQMDSSIRTSYLTSYESIAFKNSAGYNDSFYNENDLIAGKWTAGNLLKNYNNSIPFMIKSLGGAVWSVEDVSLTLEQVQEAHRYGLKVVVWSWTEHSGKTFDEDLLKTLILYGIDGIIADDIDKVLKLLNRL